MAFTVQSWGRASTTANSDQVTLQSGVLIGSPAMFTYISNTDTAATIAAANYFSTVVAELNVGDFIYAVGTDAAVQLQVITVNLDARTVTTSQSSASGDVDGPAGATDNAVVRFDGITGKIIQNSVAILDDLGNISGLLTVTNGSGAVGAPAYTFTADPDTGIWNSAANTLDVSTGGLRGFQVDASPALAVDYISVMSAATGAIGLPLVQAKGSDTNIDVGVLPKGTGGLSVRGATNAGSIKLWNQANTFYTQISSAAVASNLSYTWSLAAPTVSDQVPTFTTAGVMSFSPVTISSGGVVSAVTQLNVDNLRLDLNTISSTNAAGDIILLPDTTGVVEIGSNATKAGILRFKEPIGSGTNYVAFQAPALAGDTTYQLPNAFPAASGYALVSTTAGVMSWANPSAGTWIDQTTTPVTIVANSSYSANNAGLVTLNMPALAAFGDIFEIAGQGAGGWLLQAAGGQTLHLGASATSVAGSLASTNRYDSLKIVCTVANTTFVALSVVGNLTVA